MTQSSITENPDIKNLIPNTRKTLIDLAELGMSGRILPHSGHTPGSMVILIGSHSFVGDLIRGGTIANETPTTHFFMCDLEENQRRIGEILALNWIEHWHPGHFGPFSAEAVGLYLAKEIGE